MSTKLLIPLFAAATLLSACSERDNTRENSTPTADDTATPGGTTAPAPTDSSSAGSPPASETPSTETPGTETQPANPPPAETPPTGGG
jgi:hypothetical protein